MNQNILPIILLLILLLGGGYLLFNTKVPVKEAPKTNLVNDINSLIGKNPPLGTPTAPVKIVVFSDYQCPFCKRLHDEVIKNIKKDYIEKGLAVVYYRDFAILGNESINAALATKCAREQGKYWEYNDILFENQLGENVGSFNEANLIKFAEKLNLDKTKFEDCLKNKKYINEIQEDINEAIKLNARGTPYTLINNTPIEGALPYSEFQKVINNYLQTK